MQFYAVAAAALFATAQAACSLNDLTTISRSEPSTACASKTGYALSSLGPPTPEQYPLVCAEPTCQQVLDAVLTAAPRPCSILNMDIYALIVDPIINECQKYQTPTTPAPGPDTPTVAPTTIPEPTAC